MDRAIILEDISSKYAELFSTDTMMEGILTNAGKKISSKTFGAKYAKRKGVELLAKIKSDITKFNGLKDDMDKMFLIPWYLGALKAKLLVGFSQTRQPSNIDRKAVFGENLYPYERFDLIPEQFIPGIPQLIVRHFVPIRQDLSFIKRNWLDVRWLPSEEKFKLGEMVEKCEDAINTFLRLVSTIARANREGKRPDGLPQAYYEKGNVYPDFSDPETAKSKITESPFFTTILSKSEYKDALKLATEVKPPNHKDEELSRNNKNDKKMREFLYSRLGHEAIQTVNAGDSLLSYPTDLLDAETQRPDIDKVETAIEYYMDNGKWPNWLTPALWMIDPVTEMHFA
jgi:hypothetical protein